MAESDDAQRNPPSHATASLHPEPLPNPFQLDDPDDPISDDEDEATTTQVSLQPSEPEPPPPLAAKPQPALPEGDDDDGGAERTPPLYLPGLVVPGLFLPIPNTDPLSTLLSRHIPDSAQRPVRDVSGAWQGKDFHTLVMTNSWRALATMARDRIVSASPHDLEHVLSLWYLRLSALARLRLFNQASAECANLFAVLTSVDPPAARAHLFDNVLPFELEVMHARRRYWAGEHLPYLDALVPLLRKCKARARAAAVAAESGTAAMWKERGARVSLTIASQLVEMKDFGAALRVLEPLCRHDGGSPALRSAIARVYLQGGHLAAASQHLAAVEADPDADDVIKDMNRAIEATAYGHWDVAIKALNNVLKADPDNAVAANNLAVALLSSGRVAEGIDVMERALKASPITVTATEPWLFNLSTLYELRATTTLVKKRELLIDVARWSGDGLKTSCLKLPAV